MVNKTVKNEQKSQLIVLLLQNLFLMYNFELKPYTHCHILNIEQTNNLFDIFMCTNRANIVKDDDFGFLKAFL